MVGRHWILGGLAGAWLGLSAAVPQEAWVERGNQLLVEGKFPEALELFRVQKERAPSDPRPYFYAGVALAEAGHLSAAAAELHEALRLDPQTPEYRIFQANLLTRLGRKTQARTLLAEFAAGADWDSLATAWLWLLSDTFYRLEQNDPALSVLEVLSRREPGNSRIPLNRAQVYVAQGRYEAAREAAEESLRIRAEDNAAAHFELGKILHHQGEVEGARKALEEAARQDPDNAEYLFRLGTHYLAEDELEKARQVLHRAEKASGRIPEVYYSLGRVYQKQGEEEKASRYLRRFQEASSSRRKEEERRRQAERLLQQGEEELDQGRVVQARVLFEKVLEIDPDHWAAHGYLAEMFLDAGAEEALEHLRAMERIDPYSLVGNYLMARYWYEHRDLAEARRYAEQARALRPGNAEIRNLLGNIYFGLGRREEARREYEAAVELAPGREDFRLNLESARQAP